MKERWGLIQSGQNKKDIKIQGTKLYLKGNLYGSVTDLKFILCSNRKSSGLAEPAIKQNKQAKSDNQTSVMDTANNN